MQFLALDCWNGTQAQAEDFLSAAQITYPLLRNAGAVTNDYAGGYEYVYVVGGDGTVIYRNLTGWVGSEVEAAIEAGLEDLAATDAPAGARALTRLTAPAPNPFNPRTALAIDVPSGGDRVTLEIVDVRGRLVRRLLDGADLAAGRVPVVWDGTDDAGHTVSSGVYHFRLTSRTGTSVQKGVLVR